jgi:hypothetical protein
MAKRNQVVMKYRLIKRHGWSVIQKRKSFLNFFDYWDSIAFGSNHKGMEDIFNVCYLPLNK